jgi:peptide/nickel transport system substrate-binding protein
VLRLAAATAACFAAAAAPVQAQRTLTILPVAAPTSMDPHFESHPLNYGPQRQIYDTLLTLDTEAVLRPYLAETWRQLDDRTWEFRLREGVRFHDGTPFEAEDVAFSVARAAAVTGNQGSYAALVRGIAAVEVGAEPRALLVRTREPDPFLDRSMASILLLSRRVHAGATREDFDAGRFAVGTGPYRHVAYARGERHEIAANPDFWGGRPPWDRVTTRYVADDNARLAALRAGEADLNDTVPPGEVARLSADPQLAVFGGDGSRTIFLNPDSARERLPHVWDRHGLPLERNPLRDRRVREALSLAIDRQGIVERVLSGQGRPAEQIVSPRAPDRAPDLSPPPFDPERARRLLAEAGYPDGFHMTLHGIVEDVPDGAGVLREIAKGFGRAGIETRVEGGRGRASHRASWPATSPCSGAGGAAASPRARSAPWR